LLSFRNHQFCSGCFIDLVSGLKDYVLIVTRFVGDRGMDMRGLHFL